MADQFYGFGFVYVGLVVADDGQPHCAEPERWVSSRVYQKTDTPHANTAIKKAEIKLKDLW